MKKIAVLSNVNISFVNQNLKKHFDIFLEEGFNQWGSLFSSTESQLIAFKPEVIFLFFDFNFSNTINDLNYSNTFSYFFNLISNFANSHPNIIIFINNLTFYHSSLKVNDDFDISNKYSIEWNKILTSLLNLINVHLFDLQHLFLQIGQNYAYSQKLMQLGSIPFSNPFCKLISDKINFIVSRIGFIRKKVLCLDLDNTLWGGVLGDLGPLGIKLGNLNEGYIYSQFQSKILKIKESGILLCIVTKNEVSNVEEVFNKNPNLKLKISDFIIVKSNWNPKSQNILEISQELNLGLDSFVFIDDNPFEINEVKTQLPQVEAIGFDNLNDLVNLPEKIYNEYFFAYRLTNEDINKSQQYESIKKRDQFRNSINNFESYLNSLEMEIMVNRLRKDQTDRVLQLINKTNQFNLTTNRFSPNEFSDLINNQNHYIFVSQVKDKFSNEGLIFVLNGSLLEKKFYIENIVMSCRVMGRHIEFSILELIERYLFSLGVEFLYGKYISSAKNKPVQELFTKFGYEIIEKSDNQINYKKKLNNNNFINSIIKATWIDEN